VIISFVADCGFCDDKLNVCCM